MTDMDHFFTLTDLGLLFDIAGAVVLALDILLNALPTNAPRLVLASSALSDCNTHLLKSNFQQAISTLIGVVLLVAGFGLQLWGNHSGEKWIPLIWFLFAIGVGIVLVSWAHHYSKRFADKKVRALARDKQIIHTVE